MRGTARRLWGRPPGAPASAWALTALACVAIVAVLAPAWSQLHTLDVHNAQAISDQRRADATQGADVNRLAAIARGRGDGRVYAGSPSNWGTTLQVGAVPVFKYLESQDVDEVGYTLRTASLMTDPEFFLRDGNPSNYDIFGIRYLILGSAQRPPVPARRIQSSGPYVPVAHRVGRIPARRPHERRDPRRPYEHRLPHPVVPGLTAGAQRCLPGGAV